jgi:hypothetical protein
MRAVYWAPGLTAGASHTLSNGREVDVVEPQAYYRHLLRVRSNVVLVIENLPSGLEPPVYRAIEKELLSAYWNDHKGLVLGQRVLRFIATAHRSDTSKGRIWLSTVDRMREGIIGATSLGTAIERYGAARQQLVQAGVRGLLPEPHVAYAELVADILLLQRGIQEDVRDLERAATEQETTLYEVIQERVQSGEGYTFEECYALAMSPDDEFRGTISAEKRAQLVPWAKARPKLKGGLLAAMGIVVRDEG